MRLQAGCWLWIGVFLAATAAAEETLRIGTSGDYPPFSVGGEGFDVAVARRLAPDLGAWIEWRRFRWPELAGRVAAGDFDVVMSGVTWRPERDVRGWMTRAVAVGGPCVVGDASPARVGVNRGGVLERWARGRFPAAAIVAVDDNLSLPKRLAGGEIDALVTDSFEAPRFAPPGSRVVCEPPRDRKVYWVAPARAESLGPRIDAWLAANEERLDDLRRRWLGGDPRRLTETDHLLDLIARRLELMPLVAAAKRAAGRPIVDAAREERVLESVAASAAGHGVDPARTRELYRLLVRLARSVQDRSAGAEAQLDLERDLRPAISRLDRRIVASLAAARPIDGSALTDDRLSLLAPVLTDSEIDEARDAVVRAAASEDDSAASREDLSFGGSGLRLLGHDAFFLNVGVGAFDIAEIGGRRARAGTAAGGQIELRSGRKLLYVAPVIGLLASSDGSVMGYGGGSLDLAYGPWRLTPVLSLGGYSEGGGKRLGGVFQFHVGGSFSYSLAGGTRVGITFAHISNAYVHDFNPGTELLLLGVHLPFWSPGGGRR